MSEHYQNTSPTTSPNSYAQWNANKLQGVDVSDTAPATNQALVYNGTEYAPAAITSVEVPIDLTGLADTNILVYDGVAESFVVGVVDATKISAATVTVTTPASGEHLRYNGSAFVNAKTSHADTFTNGDLVAGVLTVAHALNTISPVVVIFDDTGVQIAPDSVTVSDANTVAVDLTTQGAIANTWSVRVL